MNRAATKLGTPVEFEVGEERWTEVKVGDGEVVLEAKPVIVDVFETDQKDADGLPVFTVVAGVALRVRRGAVAPGEG